MQHLLDTFACSKSRRILAYSELLEGKSLLETWRLTLDFYVTRFASKSLFWSSSSFGASSTFGESLHVRSSRVGSASSPAWHSIIQVVSGQKKSPVRNDKTSWSWERSRLKMIKNSHEKLIRFCARKASNEKRFSLAMLILSYSYFCFDVSINL